MMYVRNLISFFSSYPKRRIFYVITLLFTLNVMLNIANLNNYNYIICYERENVIVSNEYKEMCYTYLSQLPPIIIQTYTMAGNCVYFTNSSGYSGSDYSDAYFYHSYDTGESFIEIIIPDNINELEQLNQLDHQRLIYHEFGHFLDNRLGYVSKKTPFMVDIFLNEITTSPHSEWYTQRIGIATIGEASTEYFADKFAFMVINKTTKIKTEYLSNIVMNYINRSLAWYKLKNYIIPNYL